MRVWMVAYSRATQWVAPTARAQPVGAKQCFALLYAGLDGCVRPGDPMGRPYGPRPTRRCEATASPCCMRAWMVAYSRATQWVAPTARAQPVGAKHCFALLYAGLDGCV